MKIIFLTPYPLGDSPSQRFRFEQYLEILKSKGHTLYFQSFLSGKNWKSIFSNKLLFKTLLQLLGGFTKRILLIFSIYRYDIFFIHREASPIGPPLIEWLVTKVFKKKMIFDFDDAIWLTDRANETNIERILRCRWKVRFICKWSYKVSCGNKFLYDYALRFNSQSFINPTTLETSSYHNNDRPASKENKITTIGWTGSHSTLKYLYQLENVLQQLETKNPIQFIFIADQEPTMKLKSTTYIPWKKESEIKDLAKLDIGIMPLPDDEWSKGKCGFKALQYLSLGIPAVVSPIGVNTSIVDNNENGFIAGSDEEWIKSIETLIKNPGLRKKMGINGRSKVTKHYSVESNTSNFLSLFE